MFNERGAAMVMHALVAEMQHRLWDVSPLQPLSFHNFNVNPVKARAEREIGLVRVIILPISRTGRLFSYGGPWGQRRADVSSVAYEREVVLRCEEGYYDFAEEGFGIDGR